MFPNVPTHATFFTQWLSGGGAMGPLAELPDGEDMVVDGVKEQQEL
jgi:hypothetical protein